MAEKFKQIQAASFSGDAATLGTIQVETIALGSYVTLANLTTTERDALTASNGMVIYNATTNELQAYENGAWANLI